MSHLRGHGVRVATPVVAGPRLTAPPAPSGGTREHGSGPKPSPLRWWEQGPCAKQGHESVWLSPSKFTKAEVHAAASLCARCPVRKECAEQPLPHVGITAGKIHWDGARAAVEVRLCELCLEPMSRRGRFCSQTCKDRWHYRARVEQGEQQYAPLRAWFGRKPVSTMARECGVNVRTVYRWDASGVIPPGAVKQLTSRLGVQVEDIWPTPNNVVHMTAHRRSTTLGLNINEADDATTTSRPRPLTDLTGGPL